MVAHVCVRTQQPIGMGKPVRVVERTKYMRMDPVCVMINRMRMGIVVSSVRVEVHRPVTDVVVRGRTRIGTGVVV